MYSVPLDEQGAILVFSSFEQKMEYLRQEWTRCKREYIEYQSELLLNKRRDAKIRLMKKRVSVAVNLGYGPKGKNSKEWVYKT